MSMLIDMFIARNKRANGAGHTLKTRIPKPAVRVPKGGRRRR